MSGSTPEEAAKHLAQMEQKAKPPYLFVAYGPLGDPGKGKRRRDMAAAPKHMSFLEVYREFRQRMPSGRFTIWTGCKLDPKTGEPREVIALDSQLVEKAHALPLGGLTTGPANPASN